MLGISEESEYTKEFKFISQNARRDVLSYVTFCMPKGDMAHIIVLIQLDLEQLEYVEIDLLVELASLVEASGIDTKLCKFKENVLMFA